MVNTLEAPAHPLTEIGVLLRGYVALTVATLVALVVLSATAPHQAPQDAWVHAVIVAVFAVVLPLRLRSARRGSVAGLRAVGLIAAVLFLVNVIEVLVPGFVPVWMKAVMIASAAIMVGVILLVVRERV